MAFRSYRKARGPYRSYRKARDSKLSFVFENHSKREEFARSLREHFNLGSEGDSPFIPVYSDENAAIKQAQRLKAEGKQDVTITEIDMRPSKGRVQYRDARKLAKKYGCRTWENSEHEWLFLHCIPEWAVKYCRPA
ncbi:hypothetical protein NEMBOFW57_000385 [Staphylotrichum longicolle]|uniref:DUF7587 domain-containing protein n=1 Tax=Staphylotrichum longicolle TaxID=669026 RepID=A0AAD4I1L7_9PEZI|nr:hypothetical protein NEMBOFW57_000385 [Staphylotrichum longicolle]